MDDILFSYGISLQAQPWPTGTALDKFPVFIPSRSTPHDERLVSHPYNRRPCDPTHASEVGFPWNERVVITYKRDVFDRVLHLQLLLFQQLM